MGAEAGPAGAGFSIAMRRTARSKRPHASNRSMPFPPDVMEHGFHRKRGKFKPAGVAAGGSSETGKNPVVILMSRSSHNLCLRPLAPRHEPCLWHNLAGPGVSA